MNVDRCVCCGEYVPEGSMVCRSCACKSGAFDQVKWERDLAIAQLKDYGVSLGEKAELKKVIHAKWISFVGFLHSICSHCGYTVKNKTKYCPDCGAIMDKESSYSFAFRSVSPSTAPNYRKVKKEKVLG